MKPSGSMTSGSTTMSRAEGARRRRGGRPQRRCGGQLVGDLPVDGAPELDVVAPGGGGEGQLVEERTPPETGGSM